MQTEIQKVQEITTGWKICIKAILNDKEYQKLDSLKLKSWEDFQIQIKKPEIYFQSVMTTSEPWEDEPLEELLQSLQQEVKYLLNKSMNP